MEKICEKNEENNKKVPFLRRVFLAESEKIEVPSIELLPMFIQKLRSLFIDK